MSRKQSQGDQKSGGTFALAFICAFISVAIGVEKAGGSLVAKEFGEGWYHVANAAMGFTFAFSITKFLKILSAVIQIAGTLAWFLVVASISLTISGSYLVLQFYRVFVW